MTPRSVFLLGLLFGLAIGAIGTLVFNSYIIKSPAFSPTITNAPSPKPSVLWVPQKGLMGKEVPNTIVPESWEERSFNGEPYYVIPLDRSKNAPNQRHL
jgi:hypothetical protein